MLSYEEQKEVNKRIQEVMKAGGIPCICETCGDVWDGTSTHCRYDGKCYACCQIEEQEQEQY